MSFEKVIMANTYLSLKHWLQLVLRMYHFWMFFQMTYRSLPVECQLLILRRLLVRSDVIELFKCANAYLIHQMLLKPDYK